MAEIKFVTGDATWPQGKGVKLIVHCCNNRGAWGSGFVLALSKRWVEPETHYRNMGSMGLGAVQLVNVARKLWVANIIGQDGIGPGKDGLPPIRYEALRKGFTVASDWCRRTEATAHMPRIGSGLAGGDWALVERLVETTFIKNGVNVVVYNFPGGTFYDSRS